MVLNQTLFLAERILQVLGDSSQSLESQLAATEIAVRLLKGEPYGSLAWVNSVGESSEDANQTQNKNNTAAKPC